MSVKDRLLAFLNYLEIGQTKFEDIAGLSRGQISKMSNGISTTSLNKISIAYPELDTNWLQTGEGQMLKSDYGKIEAGDESNWALALELAILDDYLDWKSKETGTNYKALKVEVFGKARTILRNLDVLSLKSQIEGQP